MRSCCVVLAALFACRRAEPIERLERPTEPVPSFAWPQPAPSPPPPPPSLPGPVPPPVEITSFLAEAAHATGPWRVTINELAAGARRGNRFLGYRVTRARVVAQPLADELVGRLGLATSYNDGDVGCVGHPVGIAVARGSLELDLIEECSHVYLTDQGHEGRWTLFSSEMATFIRGLYEH